MGIKQIKAQQEEKQKSRSSSGAVLKEQEPLRKRTPVMLKNGMVPPPPPKVEQIKQEIVQELTTIIESNMVGQLPKPKPKNKFSGKVQGSTTVPLVVVPDLGDLPKLPPNPTEADAVAAGYTVVGKHDIGKLMWFKDMVLKAKRVAFDYETNGDPDDDTTDPQDHKLVAISMCFKKGQAIMIPVAFQNYGANWNTYWLVEHFLKPILEHPDVLLIAHNVKVEYQWSILLGIDFFFKAANRKVMDTMLMVKALALPQNTEQTSEGWEVKMGLKPATKALLADPVTGLVHGLLHVDDIKSFKDTVGRVEWLEPIPGQYYTKKTGIYNKGDQKMQKMSRSRTFDELPVNQETTDYSCSDADWSLGLYDYLYPLCVSEGIDEVLYDLDTPFMMALGEYELAGWHVSRDRLIAMKTVADLALDGDPEATTEDGRKGLKKLLNEALIEMLPDYELSVDDEGIETIMVPAGKWSFGVAKGGKKRGQEVFLEIKTEKPFNWGSNQHQPWLFFVVLGIDYRNLEKSKDTGLPGCGKDNMDLIMETYEGDSKFMKVLKEKKKYDKILTTYVEGMLPFCRKDTDKLHTNMNLVSTWRLSSKKPNLQNIPRPDNDPMGIRGVFIAPVYDPGADYSHLNRFTKPVSIIASEKLSGYTFYVNADYSQIELKVLAWFAQEAGMIKTLAEGGDLHSWVAHKVFKLACEVEQVKELYKPHRYRSKKINFGLVYGMTEFGLSKDRQMGMTVAEAEKFIDEYMATFPGVKEYAKEMIAFARKHGYVETMFGHRRPIPEINDPKNFVRKSGENKAMNTPIQGSASDIIRLAMVNLRKEAPPWYKAVMQIHDEIQSEVPVEYAVQGAVFMKGVMEREIEGFTDIMPIIAEPAVGATWDTALDLKFDAGGNPYVKPKLVKKEATDVTYEMIAPYEKLYGMAGIKIA